MLIRPTPMGAQVSATAHGLLAAVVSLILGLAAHSLGGGHIPSSTQLLVLAALALGVGFVRAGQIRSVERSRAVGRNRISATGSLAALVGGQVGAHVVLSVMDGHLGHDMAPGPLMLAWHVLVVPAAAAVLFTAERLGRALTALVTRSLLLAVAAPAVRETVVVGYRRGDDARLRPSPMVAAAGVRGPPLPN
ncbi:MAG: hypothetical protein WBA05_12425 [Gordonia sp. (in: high G+C Gram-positive bacteria)]|uniref:hypothetical protein n=1 Tax=Gordonia TaxID=2053 RepID=UPI0032637BE0